MAILFLANMFSRHSAALEADGRELTGTIDLTAKIKTRGDQSQLVRIPLRGRNAINGRLATPLQVGARAGTAELTVRADIDVQILRGGAPELSTSDRIKNTIVYSYPTTEANMNQPVRTTAVRGQRMLTIGSDLIIRLAFRLPPFRASGRPPWLVQLPFNVRAEFFSSSGRLNVQRDGLIKWMYNPHRNDTMQPARGRSR